MSTLSLTSLVVLYLEINSIFSIGEIINKYTECTQNPMNAFPCYGIYDIYFMTALTGIIILSLVIIGFKIFKTSKE